MSYRDNRGSSLSMVYTEASSVTLLYHPIDRFPVPGNDAFMCNPRYRSMIKDLQFGLVFNDSMFRFASAHLNRR